VNAAFQDHRQIRLSESLRCISEDLVAEGRIEQPPAESLSERAKQNHDVRGNLARLNAHRLLHKLPVEQFHAGLVLESAALLGREGGWG
jgi:hypothetical protein